MVWDAVCDMVASRGSRHGGSNQQATGRGVKAELHVVPIPINASASNTSSPNNIEGVSGNSISQKQWQQLISLLGNVNVNATDDRLIGESSNDTWIIDKGASNHVTGNQKLLRDMKNMMECPVGLPDGNKTSSSQYGHVNLDQRVKLENVLYRTKVRGP